MGRGGCGDRDAESGWRVVWVGAWGDREAGNGWRPGYLTVDDSLSLRRVMHSDVSWPRIE